MIRWNYVNRFLGRDGLGYVYPGKRRGTLFMEIGSFLKRSSWLCNDLSPADNRSFGGPLQFLLSYQGV